MYRGPHVEPSQIEPSRFCRYSAEPGCGGGGCQATGRTEFHIFNAIEAEMRLAALALACILLFPALAEAGGRDTASSTVEIVRADGHLGAGVQIADGLILTAAHVVRDDLTVTITDSRSYRQPARVISIDRARDLALLVPLQPARLAVSPVSCVLPQPGLRVTVTGHPMGDTFVSVVTTVAGPPEPVSDWPGLVPLRSRALPGMSGGPVIAGDGRVVALVVAAISVPGEDYGPAGAVPAADICAYLAGLTCRGYTCGGGTIAVLRPIEARRIEHAMAQ